MFAWRDMPPASSIYTSHGRPIPCAAPSTPTFYSGEIEIPPPPNTGPPTTYSQFSAWPGNIASHSQGVPRVMPGHNHPLPPSNPPSAPPPPPPVPPTPKKPATLKKIPSSKKMGIPPPPALPAPSVKPPSFQLPTSAVPTTLSALLSQQHSPQRNARLSGSSSTGYGSPSRQQSNLPPPPPPVPGDHDDNSSIEENVE